MGIPKLNLPPHIINLKLRISEHRIAVKKKLHFRRKFLRILVRYCRESAHRPSGADCMRAGVTEFPFARKWWLLDTRRNSLSFSESAAGTPEIGAPDSNRV